MTREEKIYEINELNSENKKMLQITTGFDSSNPNKVYMELRRPKFNLGCNVRITDEILITVVEMLKNKIDENNKKLDELLGVDND